MANLILILMTGVIINNYVLQQFLGICPFLGTANTMGCLAEALGMMLPGGSLYPSSTSMRRFSARESGRAVMELYRRKIKPRDIMTKAALENSITVLSAIGGSLNALLHIPALASELDIPFSWAEIAEITSRTPLLTDIVPNGNNTVIDLYKAGGIPALMKTASPLLHREAMTVTTRSVGENLDASPDPQGDIIRPFDKPIKKSDGIQVLYGNLAPDGALVKTSAVPSELRYFEGRARVFNNEDECYCAFAEKKIVEGDAVIIRYEGPKGGPGMKEMHRVTEILKKIPNTAVITDGRFSGASGGLSVGYLCPEASEGGPIALVEDGDGIIVDLEKGIITLAVDDEVLDARRENLKIHIQKTERGVLPRYAKSVSSTKNGATLI